MSNETITAQKSFPVAVNELYKAWTEEAALEEWWKPAGRKLRSVKADLKEGGSIRYDFEADGNSNGELVIEGNYKTVVPEENLVYTWNWILDDAPVENGEYELNVAFKSDDNGSQLTITQQSETAREGIHPHKEGWDNALNNLEEYLSNK